MYNVQFKEELEERSEYIKLAAASNICFVKRINCYCAKTLWLL